MRWVLVGALLLGAIPAAEAHTPKWCDALQSQVLSTQSALNACTSRLTACEAEQPTCPVCPPETVCPPPTVCPICPGVCPTCPAPTVCPTCPPAAIPKTVALAVHLSTTVGVPVKTTLAVPAAGAVSWVMADRDAVGTLFVSSDWIMDRTTTPGFAIITFTPTAVGTGLLTMVVSTPTRIYEFPIVVTVK